MAAPRYAVLASTPRPADRMQAVVYFAHDPETGLTKIGTTWAARVSERIREHERTTGHILTLLGAMPGGTAEEQTIHRRLKDTCARPEWFHSSDELAELVLNLPFPSTAFPISVGRGGLQS